MDAHKTTYKCEGEYCPLCKRLDELYVSFWIYDAPTQTLKNVTMKNSQYERYMAVSKRLLQGAKCYEKEKA